MPSDSATPAAVASIRPMREQRSRPRSITPPPAAGPAFPHVPAIFTFLFCLYVVQWYTEFGIRSPFLGAIRFEFLLGSLLVVIAALFHAPRPEGRRPSTPIGIACLYGAMLLSFVFTVDFHLSWTIFVDRVVKFSMMALFIATFVRAPGHLRVFYGSVFLAWLRIGQVAFRGQITGGLVWESQGIMRLHGEGGSRLAHPNSLAGFGVGNLPYIYALVPVVGWVARGFLLLQLLFVTNIIIFTGSRTGYVAVFAVAIAVYFRSRARKQYLLWATIAVAISVFLVPQQYRERFSTIFSGQEREGSSRETRIQILVDAVTVFKENPLGVGVGGFPVVRERRFGRTQDTHNLYLEVLTNLGIQGGIAFLVFLSTLFADLRFATRRTLEQLKRVTRLQTLTATRAEQEALETTRRDLELMRASCVGTSLFLVARLALGMFGMDLYEIYWWFASGQVIAVFEMTKITGAWLEHLEARSAAAPPRSES